MSEEFVRQRITELRIKKGVSEYRMSMDMGRSKGYIQCISSGRSMPSFSEFLYMCSYLGVTPREFFNEENQNPALIQSAVEIMKTLSDADIRAVLGVLDRLKERNV